MALIPLTIGYLDGIISIIPGMIIENITAFASVVFLIPFVPLMHQARQRYQLVYYDEIAHGEFSSSAVVAETSYEIPVAGWASKFQTTVFQEVAFDQDFAYALAWAADNEQRTWESGIDSQNHIEYLLEHWNAASVTEMQVPYPIQVFHLDNAIEDTDEGAITRTNRFGSRGIFYEQGQLIFATSGVIDIGTPTTGTVNIVSVLTIDVAAFDSSKQRREEVAPWVYIMFEGLSATEAGFTWPAHTALRIVNLRATLWTGLDTDNQAWLTINNNATQLELGQVGIEMHAVGWLDIILPIQDGQAVGTTFTPVVTAYKKGPFYLHKGEGMQTRFDDINGYGMIEFQYIPNFGHLAEFNRRSEIGDFDQSDHTNQFYPLFTVPYDMYVTSLEGSVQVSDATTDVAEEFYVMGIKNKNLLDNDDLLLGYANADVEGNILGADHQAGAMPWVLKSIPVAIDTSVSTLFQTKWGESVADFYPRGSIIGMWVPDGFTDTIATFNFTIIVEALNRIKTNKHGTNVLQGANIARMEMIGV